MRRTALILAALLTTAAHAIAQNTTSSVSYSTPDRGGTVIETAGGTDRIVVGYGRVQPSSSTTPSGVAIFGFRQNGVLVTEAGVPGMTPIISGRTYAEINGPINTGIAFQNPNSGPVTITFNFTDQSGNDFGQNSLVLDGNTQTAKFLNEAPFSATSFAGTFTFNATAPVGVIALRTLVNERGEFLVFTQTVTPLPAALSSSAVIMGHFADGGGWRTQLLLVNTSDVGITGTVQFFSEGTPTLAGAPITLNVNGTIAASFPYSIRARTAINLATVGAGTAATAVGSIRITPDAGSTTPSASTVFSYSQNGVTVSGASVQMQPPGTAFRTYAEVTSSTSNTGGAGAIQSGIAITNNSSTSATVNFEVNSLNGFSTGLTASVVVPASGHTSKFVHELFPTLSLPFRGVLRASSSNSIFVVSLRTRYNERGDFLITTTAATNEASASSSGELMFPHIVDRGGYTTQFILFSGLASQSTAGTLRFFGQDGQPLSLTVR
jgi:hypothetical protein